MKLIARAPRRRWTSDLLYRVPRVLSWLCAAWRGPGGVTCVVRGLSAPGLVGAGFRRRRAFPPPATLPRCPPSRGGRAAGRRRSAARFLRLDVQRIGQGIYSPRAGLPAKLWTSLAPVSGIEFSVSRIFILGLVITAGPHSGRRRYGAPAIFIIGGSSPEHGRHPSSGIEWCAFGGIRPVP